MLLPLALAATISLPTSTYIGSQNQLHVNIPKLDSAATIDGVLSEPVWQQAALLTGFSQFSPSDGIPASDSTEVLVWYSKSALYVGIRAFEAHGSVHATLANRDKIDADDNVQLLLGTFHDHRQAYVFAVNPFGVQMDGVLAEQGQSLTGSWTPTLAGRVAADLSQDFVFSSKGHLTDYGYEVEMMIPFKSLKYQPTDVQSWDINVVRKVQHSGFEDSWVPAKRDNASFLAQSGSLDGLSGLDRGLVLDFNPVVTMKMNGAPGANGWAYGQARPQLGGNVRWGITNNLTLNGTIRPDFAEVESDAGQFVIDPRQALFFPEKRPFFLDGLDQFSTPHNLIYTRRIAKPEAAVKLAGRIAGNGIAFLSAEDDPTLSRTKRDHPIYNILRAQRDLGGSSRIGMAYTDRIAGPDYNRLADVDGRLLFGKVYSTSFQAAKSFDHTAGVPREGPLWDGAFARNGKQLGFRYQFSGISDQFRAGSGFISRSGIVHAAVDHRATRFGAKGSRLETLTGDLLLDDQWQYRNFFNHGDAQDKKAHLSASAGLRGGWNVGLGYYLETFGFDNGLYANYKIQSPTGVIPFVGRPRITNHDYVASLATPQWSKFSGNLLYVGGQDENFFEWAQANIDLVIASVSVRPDNRTRVQGDLQFQDYRRRRDNSLVGRNAIPRVKLEYQLTRSVFMRLVGEYDLAQTDDLRDETRTNYPLLINGALATATRSRTLHGDYLFSYTPSPGTVLFLGYGGQGDGLPDPNQRFNWQPIHRTSDYFFVKYGYLFRM